MGASASAMKEEALTSAMEASTSAMEVASALAMEVASTSVGELV